MGRARERERHRERDSKKEGENEKCRGRRKTSGAANRINGTITQNIGM